MRTNKINWIHCLLFIVFSYQLYWISLGAYFSYPNAEDLSVVTLSRDKGIIKGALHLLRTFDGRYTTNLLHGMNPLAFNGYYQNKWVPIFTILFSWLSVFHFLNVKYESKKSSVNLLYSLGFVTMFFSILDLSQSLYWMICSFVYIYPLILFLSFYTFYLKYKKYQKFRDFILSVLLLVLAVGCCELYIPLFGAFILFKLYQNREHQFQKKTLFWLLIIFIASSLLFVTSPGITNRFSILEENRTVNAIEMMSISLSYLWMSIKSWGYIPLVLFIVLFNLEYKQTDLKRRTYYFWHLTLCLLLAVLLWVIVVFLMGNTGFPLRILPVFVALFTYVFLITLPIISICFQSHKKSIAILFLIGTIAIPNSYSLIKKDYLSGRLSIFKEEMDKQYKLLKANRNKEKCIRLVVLNDVQEIIPKSIATNPYIKPNREEGFWNRAYEEYFYIDEIRLKTDTNKTIINKTYEILY